MVLDLLERHRRGVAPKWPKYIMAQKHRENKGAQEWPNSIWGKRDIIKCPCSFSCQSRVRSAFSRACPNSPVAMNVTAIANWAHLQPFCVTVHFQFPVRILTMLRDYFRKEKPVLRNVRENGNDLCTFSISCKYFHIFSTWESEWFPRKYQWFKK